jgi:transposase InsO family protein
VIERKKFIFKVQELMESGGSFAEICRQCGVSRKTGYKWVERYNELGPDGLEDVSHARGHHPNEVKGDVVNVVLGCRREHKTWGPKKIRAWIQREKSGLLVPAASTIGDLIKKHGLERPRRWRPRVPVPHNGMGNPEFANDTWAVDFKGHFPLSDKRRCHPLTVTDHASRYLVACQAMLEQKTEPVRQQMEFVFREFGQPNKMRSDNGVPFASVGIGGLSALSIWWMKLGIQLERSRPGCPQDNGRHERMHRTLKEETTTPPKTIAEQQRAFDQFRQCFNNERPHEALDQKTPSQFYVISRKAYSGELKSPEYDGNKKVHHVNEDGRISFKGKHITLGKFLAKEPIGVEATDEDVWRLFYGPVVLGELRLNAKAITLVRAE